MTEKYDAIGRNYNHTRRADGFLVERFYHFLEPDEGQLFLDIGCGTGNYTIALDEKGLKFIGVDPSVEMLKNARARASVVRWKIGRSEEIPLDEGSVDGITAILTMHHWDDLGSALRELHRVLKPGGRLVIFTSTPEQMEGYWLNHYFPDMLMKSASRMPEFDTVEIGLKNAGLEIVETEKYFVRTDIEDRFLYSGKHHPMRYLEEVFRKGISSFTNMAAAGELDRGLRKIKDDIETEKIEAIMNGFVNEKGDYLFVIAAKS